MPLLPRRLLHIARVYDGNLSHMKIYVQLGEAPLPVDERVRYRAGFKDFVTASNRPEDTRVVLVEPNPEVIPRLEAMWAEWGQVEIINAHIDFKEGTESSVFYSSNDVSRFPEVFSPDSEYVRRFFPHGELHEVNIPTVACVDFLNDLEGGASLDALSMDLRSGSLEGFQNTNWRTVPVKTVILTTDGLRQSDLTVIAKLMVSEGFSAAGRSFGDAKTGMTFSHAHSFRETLNFAAAQQRVNFGAIIARFQEYKSNHSDRANGLSEIDRHEIEDLIRIIEDNHFELEPIKHIDDSEILMLARECYEIHGYWPISFSYPRLDLFFNKQPEFVLSPITPGFPYSFDDEREYIETYGNSRLALTHRKAGWDCFRHLEIIASGSVPVMADISQVPKFSMVHYPKSAMNRILKNVYSGVGIPINETRNAFQDFLRKNLTSRSMAEYVLAQTGYPSIQRVLFVDENLDESSDYLSVMTLIGLKQILGSDCDVLFPVDYIYKDTSVETSEMYGRGFGYTKVLDPQDRGSRESKRAQPKDDLGDLEAQYDLVVIGSIARNYEFAQNLLAQMSPERTVWIHGEDRPPSAGELQEMKKTGTHLFIRSIEA